MLWRFRTRVLESNEQSLLYRLMGVQGARPDDESERERDLVSNRLLNHDDDRYLATKTRQHYPRVQQLA